MAAIGGEERAVENASLAEQKGEKRKFEDGSHCEQYHEESVHVAVERYNGFNCSA